MPVSEFFTLSCIRHHSLRGVALLFLALGIIEASVVGCGGISTPTTSRPPVTPTPGIRVPVKGGNWQITIVKASRTTTWTVGDTIATAKSGTVFLVLDVTFDNLSSSQQTIISTTDAMVISQDGKMFTPVAFETKNIIVDASGTPVLSGLSCIPCSQPEIRVSGNSLSIRLVYILDASPSSSTNLKFQFQQVPPIPFSAT